MFGTWRWRRRKGPPLPVNTEGLAKVVVTGTPLVGKDAKVQVTDDSGMTYATVENSVWYDKMLFLQSPVMPVDGDWSGVAIGLGPEKARILGAALLGLTHAQVEALPA